MKRKILCVLMLLVTICCTACQEEQSGTAQNLSTDIQTVLAKAKYENLDILFDEMMFYDGQELKVAKIDWYHDLHYPMSKETMELYANVAYPDLLGVESLDKNKMYDIEGEQTYKDGVTIYETSYDEILTNIDTYENMVCLGYLDPENSMQIYAPTNWRSGVYIQQGVIGGTSAFSAKERVKDEKVYDCRIDDLSDSYMLMDGEKTVAEAKTEMEAYFNAHYPIDGRQNGIEHEIWSISVGKIEGTDYYAFHGYRTFVYNGIPFTEARTNAGLGKYFSIMGESYLCESNKMDVTIGVINGYTEPEVIRIIENPIPFQEVMDRVAYYLTGETKFQLLYGGLEYRLYMDTDTQRTMTPYWFFVAKNPNDDSMLKIYVDMETGEINSSSYK